jgi:hypothetical protein
MQFNAAQCNTMHHNATQHNATQCNTTQQNTAQQITAQQSTQQHYIRATVYNPYQNLLNLTLPYLTHSDLKNSNLSCLMPDLI